MTIEDCLEIILGFNKDFNFSVNIAKEDIGILNSLSKQIRKETALTDRQLEMLKSKICIYRDKLIEAGIDYDIAVNNLRFPLRQIDRTKFIKIVDDQIQIRFPFSKKLIVLIDEISRIVGPEQHFHRKGSHIHQFNLTEQNVHHIMKRFQNKEFDIDEELFELNDEITKMLENAPEYVPGIYDFEIRNSHPKAKAYMLNLIGEPSPNNIHLYKDRAQTLGLIYFDSTEVQKAINRCSPLTQKIVNRKKASIFVNSKTWSIHNVINSLFELNRFPLVVVVDEFRHNDLDAIENFYTLHKALSHLIDNSEMSVLFRLDNIDADNVEFNNFVKRQKLNNVVDENTKVVYIKDKAPKFLIKNNWQPSACLSCTSNVRLISRNNNFIGDTDLTIHWEQEMSTMAEYYSRSSFAQGIDKL